MYWTTKFSLVELNLNKLGNTEGQLKKLSNSSVCGPYRVCSECTSDGDESALAVRDSNEHLNTFHG